MKKSHRSLKGLALALFVFSANSHAAANFSECVVFGDSLSDNGNLAVLPDFAFLSDTDLPYNHGFNDGKYAAEVLCESLGLKADASLYLTGQPPSGTNYAVAGARAAGISPIDLSAQVDTFLAWHENSAPADALFLVWIGGNDLRDARDADSLSTWKIIDNAVDAVDTAVARLLDAGATNVVVVNIPDIGRSPETRLMGGETLATRATDLTRIANKLLRLRVSKMEATYHRRIAYFDLFRTLQAIDRHSETLGFINDQDACFSSASFNKTGQRVYHPDCLAGALFNEFVFFDEIHPTGHIQSLVGIAMQNVVGALRP